MIFLLLEYRESLRSRSSSPVLLGTRRRRENQNFLKNTCQIRVGVLLYFNLKFAAMNKKISKNFN
ncbi:MAG: hypothetical protein II726_02835, partial [Elusimicrobiaceae bacterium]|nr:hypothetical protein [Elusimicrobiaceae bacterium]